MNSNVFRLMINLYPPYLGTGIRVKRVAPDFREIDVEMGLHWYNRNLVGTHFGGNIAAMTDPFYMLMSMQILGRDYVVWDRSAQIEFLEPGRGRVRAEFRISQGQIDEILAATANGEKFLPTLPVDVVDDDGGIVARVRKTLYIRRKRRRPRGARRARAAA